MPETARSLAIASAIALAGAAHAGVTLVTPKHRAAPPSEMAPGGPLAPFDPAVAPLWSRAATLRVALDDEGAWTGELPIDAAGEVRLLALSDVGDALRVELRPGPDAEPIRLEPGEGVRRLAAPVDGLGEFSGYVVRAERPGRWSASVRAPAGVREALIVYATESPLGLRVARLTDRAAVGEPVRFRASAHELEAAGPLAAGVRAELVVRDPDGAERTVPMTDPDGDGVFEGAFEPRAAGRHTAGAVAEGTDGAGRPFRRTAWSVFDVVEGDVALPGTAGAWPRADTGALWIEIDADDARRDEHRRVTAQLWGAGPGGEPVPVCWIGGMAFPFDDPDRPGGATLALSVDPAWLDAASASAPLELREVRVRRPGTMALLASAARIDVELEAALPRAAGRAAGQPRRTAPRDDGAAFPVATSARPGDRVAGGRNLMLVHGYCAGGNPWPPGDFDGAIEVFSDPNANRSHDEFALLIKALGDQSKSFGVVAHSQGGAAALHLYTFYFSGLDWAQGPRLIQSLGTPYQGTPLAGNLALLGDIFGSGCGENTDLSVDGAAAWLAGIPNDARARVHFWTTSFSGSACNFLSGLFLSNPEDGVVEVARGQLPGAVGMGNTVGQCHTTGMSNPAQYLDATRNAEMNTNAAR